MFEASLLSEHHGREHLRWFALASVAVQTALVAALLLAPLLHAERLPMIPRREAIHMVTLAKPRVIPPKPVVVHVAAAADAHAAPAAAAAPVSLRPNLSATHIPSLAEPAVILPSGSGMGSPQPGLAAILTSGSPTPKVTVRPGSGGNGGRTLRISTGVSLGLLLTPIRPVYPAIARAAHVSGTVVVTATIDPAGRIIGLQVVSGPMMLRQAAADAVRDARYKPYLLNGQPTAVETTFAVNFVMGS
jgi:protein TonB